MPGFFYDDTEVVDGAFLIRSKAQRIQQRISYQVALRVAIGR